MKLSSFQKIAPADVAVGSIPFRGKILDIFPLTSTDIFWLLTRAPEVAKAWGAEGSPEEKGVAMLAAVGKAGPEVVKRILIAGTQATEEELADAGLSLDEEVDILAAILDLGIPENMVGKLRGAITGAIARAQGQRPIALSETPSSVSSIDSSQPDTTLTK